MVRFIFSAAPLMTINRLLKSCATPPVSCPIASIRCDCRKASSARLRAVMSISPPRVRTGLPSDQFLPRREQHVENLSRTS